MTEYIVNQLSDLVFFLKAKDYISFLFIQRFGDFNIDIFITQRFQEKTRTLRC